eukprot:1097877-Pelagomonas_calceolata.AAC.1
MPKPAGLSELQLEHRELGSNHQNFRTTAMEKLMSTFPLSRFPLSKDQRRPPPPVSVALPMIADSFGAMALKLELMKGIENCVSMKEGGLGQCFD